MIVRAWPDEEGTGGSDEEPGQVPHPTRLPQHPLRVDTPGLEESRIPSRWREGQDSHRARELTVSSMAEQKALPKGSSLQAAQLEGSPEHVASVREDDDERGCSLE